MRHQTELLAPAGSFDSLRAAVNAGADAVYIGGSRFGARAYADNPDEKGLCEAIRFAHLHGCDLYLTVNTLLKDEELEDLGAYLRPYYESGLDGVIVQDLGVFSYLKETFPDLPLHASTQMTVLGADGAAFLKEQGAARVVTARELSLEEIRRIHETVEIEIESFVHGALCYCYSGQCLFSSMLGGRSGNRGRCAQPCRLPYQWKDGSRVLSSPKETYLLSPKDMCTIEILPEILEAGVCSLKIEGRMKRPEYTAGVVRIYRKYLDQYLEFGKERYHVEKQDYAELQALYNRGGFSRGYYQGQGGREMMSLSRPGHFEGKGKREIRQKQEYEALLARLHEEYLEKDRKEKIQGIFRISTEFPTEFVVKYKEIEICVQGEAAQKAQNRPVTRMDLEKQLRKTGGTPFEFEQLEIELDGEVFCPVGELNRMRREALEKLEKAYVQKGFRKIQPDAGEEKTSTFLVRAQSGASAAGENPETGRKAEEDPASEGMHSPVLRVQLENPELLQEVLKVPEVKSVYLTSEKTELERLGEYAAACHGTGKECALVLPAVFRLRAINYFLERLELLKAAGLDAVVVKNLDEIGFLKESGLKLPVIADHNVYSWNRRAQEFWKEQGVLRDTLPLELNAKELARRGCRGSELIAYGYLPLMTTAGCIHKNLEKCDGREVRRTLADRYQKEFPVVNYCRYCYNIIYNCEPLSLLYSREEVARLSPEGLRLCFTMEDREQTRRVLSDFVRVFCHGAESGRPVSGYTKGHLKRGVQ